MSNISVMGQKTVGGFKDSEEQLRERDGKIFYTSKNYWSNPTQARGCTTGSNKPDKWMPREVISLIIMLKCDTDKVNC